MLVGGTLAKGAATQGAVLVLRAILVSDTIVTAAATPHTCDSRITVACIFDCFGNAVRVSFGERVRFAKNGSSFAS